MSFTPNNPEEATVVSQGCGAQCKPLDDMHHVLTNLRQALRAVGDPSRLEFEQRYLKSTDDFLGVSVPAGQRIAREFRREYRPSPAEVRTVVAMLWATTVHEEKRLAVQILGLYQKMLLPEDWPLLERWIRESGSWDLVDEISAHLLGPLAERYPELDAALTDWIADENLWVRRAALVSYVLRLRHATAQPARVRGLCDSLMLDREYFVRKAVGWLLRECAVLEPAETVVFLQRWPQAPRMVLREAVSKLDAIAQTAVL